MSSNKLPESSSWIPVLCHLKIKDPELNVSFYFIFLQCQPIYSEPNEKGSYICEYKASWRVKNVFLKFVSVLYIMLCCQHWYELYLQSKKVEYTGSEAPFQLKEKSCPENIIVWSIRSHRVKITLVTYILSL